MIRVVDTLLWGMVQLTDSTFLVFSICYVLYTYL